MIEEAYVSFETAKLLKEKGFDEPCHAYYEDNGYFIKSHSSHAIRNITNPCFFGIASPTQAMTMRWLREEKRTSIIIEFDVTKRGYCPYVHQLDYDMDWVVKWRINIPMKYEEAVEAALKYCLENLI